MAAVWVLAMTLGAGWTPNARGAGIFRDLTARDRSQPIVLSEAGEPIPLRSASHPAALLSTGTVPAYLAFPLDGGEHLPAGIPTVATGPQAGRERRRPDGSHARDPVAVERRPDRLAIRHRGDAGPVLRGRVPAAICPRPLSCGIVGGLDLDRRRPPSTTTGTTSIASILGLNAPAADWSINGIPASELSQWVKTGSQEISHLTSLGVEGVAKTLGLKGLKATPTASGLNLEAQYLVPPSAQASPGPLPVPAPEPAAWLVFGLILGAAGLRRRADRRSRWTSRV